jgi:parvulin-like peptidyl-prolyl isomerase
MLTVINERISWHDSVVSEAKMSGKVSELIRGAARRQIITEQAQKVGIKPTEEEVQLAADRFRTVSQLETAKDTLEWLQAHFLSVEDLEQIVTYQLITEKLTHHLFADRVEHFFYQNLLEYSSAIIYEVVLVDRDLAMEIFYCLQEEDLNFAEVAHQYIVDPELNRRGGYLGTINRKQLRPEISAAVFAAKPPQLIEPVVTAVGTHLIYVEEIIQPQLDDLYQHILMEMFDRWLEPQIAKISF